MTRKVYRTAQGKMVDLGALQLRNENVRAVGNMGVNARGDLVDSQNRPIQTRNEQVSRQYRRQVNTENRVASSLRDQERKSEVQQRQAKIPTPPEDFDDDFDRSEIGPSATSGPAIEAGGLAAAIARARQVRQEPLRTTRDIARSQSGVKKL